MIVQLPTCRNRTACERVITLPPEVPVIVPLHCGVTTFAVSVTPAGNVSVKATPVNATVVFGLLIVKVRVDVPPATMGFGEKDLLIEGGATTVIDALAVFPVPPFVDVTVTLFVLRPMVAPTHPPKMCMTLPRKRCSG